MRILVEQQENRHQQELRQADRSEVYAEQTSFRPDPQLLEALTGQNAVAERALALRTRRAVFHALSERRTGREEGRRHLLIALLLTGALTLALAPALWTGIEDMLSGETLLDLPGMLVALGMTLFAAVVAVLFLLGGEQQASQVTRSTRR